MALPLLGGTASKAAWGPGHLPLKEAVMFRKPWPG